MASLAFCTVTTVSHLHFTATVFSSLRQTHPSAGLFVLLVDGEGDESSGRLGSVTDVVVVPLAAVVKDQQLRRSLTFYYTPFELCCALKPLFTRELLDQGFADTVVYVDNDLYFYAEIPPEALPSSDRSIVLTPQCLGPSPIPLEVGHLYYGAFNGGYFAVRAGRRGRKILDYWWSRCERHCLNDRGRGLFLDQAWLNLLPALFSDDLAVVRHPGCNVARWNLHERPLGRSGAGYVVGDKPLIFFHWSQVDLSTPDRIHRANQTAFVNDESAKVLKELHSKYVAAVEAQAVTIQAPYGFSSYADGQPIDPSERRRYWGDIEQGLSPQADPFSMRVELRRRVAQEKRQSSRRWLRRLLMKYVS